MPSLQDMRERAKEAGLMKLDKLIATRQHIPTNEFPIPVKELCERYERLYTGCINDRNIQPHSKRTTLVCCFHCLD